jgi:glycosyltransferase involved in cell wall biosynthesis
MNVFQHVSEFSEGDGIGNDIIGLNHIFERIGFQGKILTQKTNTEKYQSIVLEPQKIKVYNSIHILHYGGEGYPLEFFEKSNGYKILKFHNITPSIYFKNYLNEDTLEQFERSYMKSIFELQLLTDMVHEIWFDSMYNQKLINYLFYNKNKSLIQKIVPICGLNKFRSLEIAKDNFSLISISRIVPHKKIEDILSCLYYLKKIDHRYKLIFIGKESPIFSKYADYLYDFVEKLGLQNSVIWMKNANDEDKNLALHKSGLYISMSEHEGFGIPILEAFFRGIPVIAYKQEAIKEIMDGTGILFHDKQIDKISEMIHFLNMNSSIKSQIVKSQNNVIQKYNSINYQNYLIDSIGFFDKLKQK